MRSCLSLAHPSALPVRAEDCVVGNRGSVFGWQISTSAVPSTDASLSCHTRNVFEERLPVVVGKVAKTLQRSADRLDHHLRRAHGSGGQNGAVEHRNRGCGIGRTPQHHPCEMEGSWRIAKIPEGRTDPHPRRCRPRQQGNNRAQLSVGRGVHDSDLQVSGADGRIADQRLGRGRPPCLCCCRRTGSTAPQRIRPG
jgi:hypothetical protein